MKADDLNSLEHWKARALKAEAEAVELKDRLAQLEALVAGLQRQIFGRKTEKMASVDAELRKAEEQQGQAPDPDKGKAKRKANAETRANLPTEEVEHKVPEEQKHCPKCGGTDFRPLGKGDESVVYHYIPARVVRQKHRQEKLVCRCGEHIVKAPGPDRVFENSQYSPAFIAQVVVAKCLDCLPLYRQEKQFSRLGIPVARSTMVGLFQSTGAALKPVSDRLLELVAGSDIVQADETPLKMQSKETGYLWTFLTDDAVCYKYAASRSGKTPEKVLGGGAGTLVVDGYSGYNRVFTPDGWSRAGCLAHARRKFFEALGAAPTEARQAMDHILSVYRVEHEARERGILRSNEHSRLREQQSRPLMKAFHAWLLEQQALHPPKGPMGKAIAYSLNNWEALMAFLDNASLPLDNNASERALRVVALGRKNYLFVGHEEAGEHLAGLLSLLMTCQLHQVNPHAWLTDVLLRIQSHPQARLDELLPQNWARHFGQSSGQEPANDKAD
jgi:transposase